MGALRRDEQATGLKMEIGEEATQSAKITCRYYKLEEATKDEVLVVV
jgi:hypothetical protein